MACDLPIQAAGDLRVIWVKLSVAMKDFLG